VHLPLGLSTYSEWPGSSQSVSYVSTTPSLYVHPLNATTIVG
jgi:hypothetical protein